MRRFLAAALLAVAAVTAAPAYAAPGPKPPPPHIDDDTTDANFLNGQGVTDLPPQRTSPGSQRYADVDTVSFENFFVWRPVGRRIVRTPFAFFASMALAADPVPAASTANVFHIWGSATCRTGAQVGLVYRTNPATGRGSQAEFALRDTCTGKPRETPVLGKVTGELVQWAVVIDMLPKEVKVRSALTNLRFEVREAVPAQLCTPAVTSSPLPSCELGYGVIDEGRGSRPFVIGG